MSVYPAMARPLILASASATRAGLLQAAGVAFSVHPARIDEAAAGAGLAAAGATPRDIADALAEMKGRKVAGRHPQAVVIGCDQVLEFEGKAWSKPATPDAGRAQLQSLRGQTHVLHSAVVLYADAQPIWRQIGEVRLTMRTFSDAYLDSYLTRNWDRVRHSVGVYQIEQEGSRLFSRIDGDYFSILGLPLLPLLAYLSDRGFIPS